MAIFNACIHLKTEAMMGREDSDVYDELSAALQQAWEEWFTDVVREARDGATPSLRSQSNADPDDSNCNGEEMEQERKMAASGCDDEDGVTNYCQIGDVNYLEDAGTHLYVFSAMNRLVHLSAVHYLYYGGILRKGLHLVYIWVIMMYCLLVCFLNKNQQQSAEHALSALVHGLGLEFQVLNIYASSEKEVLH